MKTDINLSPEGAKTSKRSLKYIILTCIILMGVNSLVLSPLYVVFSTDILFNTTVLPDVIHFLITMVTTLTYAVCFSFMALSVTLASVSASVRSFVAFIIALVCREVIDLLMTFILYNDIDNVDVFSSVSHLLLDGGMMAGVMLLSSVIAKRFYMSKAELRRAEITLGRNDSAGTLWGIFPIEKVFDKKNPLLLTSMIIAIALLTVSIISRTIYIFAQISYIYAPSFDIFSIIGSYMSDILTGVVYYVASWLLFSGYYKKNLLQ